MNVYKKVVELIDGVEKEFVMIDIDEYNNYMLLTCTNYEKLQTKKQQAAKREERNEKIENKYIQSLEKKDRQEQELEDKINRKIEKEAMVNRHNNEARRKIKEEFKQEHKELFDNNPLAEIQTCDACHKYKVFPTHFINENGKDYIINRTNKKNQYENISCCVDCFLHAEDKKEKQYIEKSIYCKTCDCTFIAYTDDIYIKHQNSAKHKKNMNLKNAAKNKELKVKLELLSNKELHSICSKSLTEGTYLISNYTRMKKEELVKKMYDLYDKLIFDFY